MHFLHLELERNERLRAAVADLEQRILGNPLRQGLLLDLNPYWLAACRLAQAGLREGSLYGYYAHDMAWPMLYGPFFERPDLVLRFDDVQEFTNAHFGERPADWQPFLLRVAALPSSEADAAEREWRQQLLEAAREASIPTVVESRPRPQLVASCGGGLTNAAGGHGTLGGFLRDRNTGGEYAVTCGHVVSSGFVDSGGSRYGSCAHARPPVPLPATVRCHAACGHLTDLDIALIAPVGAAAGNAAKTVASTVCNQDIVEMHGMKSGVVKYEVGAAVINHWIGGSCWSHLYLVGAPVSSGIAPAWLQLPLTPPPAHGDSGAWLLHQSTEWAGMVVASDNLYGYALPATCLITNANAAFNMDLELL